MGRYQTANTSERFDGKQIFVSKIMPRIPMSANDIYIISTQGDTLEGLALKYYNDKNDWWIIANANKVGKGTRFIEPGLQIRIPMNVTSIKSQFQNQ
jgi:hypothetical protein